MIAVDFFCGAGGLTRGLLDAGVEVLAGIDVDQTAQESYEWNNSGVCFIHEDIRRLRTRDLLRILGGMPRRHVLFAGCAPCRSFSRQRRAHRRHADATLLGAFGRAVELYKPGWVLVENVPGLAEVPGFSTFRRFRRALRTMGYRTAEGVLNACHFGVPQHRRRYVLLASLTQRPKLPAPTHSSDSEPFETVRGWIAHYPPIAAGEEHPAVANHVASPLSRQNLQRIRATPHDGGDRTSWPAHLQLECHHGNTRSYTDVYGRLWWDRYAPTLTGKCNSLSNGRFGHPEQDRAISLREAASLQTFPDDYVFFGLKSHIAQHIGNAVPVRLGELLGHTILQSAGARPPRTKSAP